jgi:hemerythrin
MASVVGWSPDLALGSSRIDGQHKHLFELVDALRAAMMEGRGRAVVGDVVAKLETYTKTHFALEEELLSAASYPHLAEHLRQHQAFTAKVAALRSAVEGGSPTASIDTLTYLSGWLAEHVRTSDRRYAPFLARAGLL